MAGRKGFALLVVLGTLGVLALLATAFVTLARLERRASQQRLNATRALLLARSGLEDAQARLSAGQDPQAADNRYAGENWDGSADGLLSFYESSQEVYRRTGGGTAADLDACPVAQAMRPSFFVRQLGNPAVISVGGRDRGLSGRFASAEAVYALKVEDESAKINVNGGFLDEQDRDSDAIPDCRDPDIRRIPADPKDTGRGWNFQLARILNVLGAQPQVGVTNLGTLVLQNRPMGGYASVADLQVRIGTGQDLSPYLTVCSWTDAKVVHPNAYLTQPATASLSEVKKERLPLALEEEGRPPVNLNTASRPVLIALMDGLQAVRFGRNRNNGPRTISSVEAGKIADRLVLRRAGDPFETWGEFAVFCDTLVSDVFPGLGLEPNLIPPDILRANFDPNTGLNKEIPDQLMFRWVDKSDLTAWSTEGSLYPTGTFTLTALGRILGPDGRLLAERSLGAWVEAFTLVRQTTQKDFVGGNQKFQDYLSLAGDTVLGHTTGASDPSWKTWGKPTGLGVVTYPNSPLAVREGKAEEVDGAVALATLETDPTGNMTFLHHFDDSLDADQGVDRSRASPGPGGCDTDLQTDAGESIWPRTPGREPGVLLPDGLQIQPHRCPAFKAQPNLPTESAAPPAGQGPTCHGALGFWVKRFCERKTPVNEGGDVDFSCIRGALDSLGNPVTQAFMVGRYQNDCQGIFLENEAVSADKFHEIDRVMDSRDPAGMARYPGLRWQFMAALWDTDETVRGSGMDCDVVVLSLLQESLHAPSKDYFYPPGEDLDPSQSQDLADGSTFFVIGCQGGAEIGTYLENVKDVIDEFAICDFTDDAPAAQTSTQTWAAQRYNDGRYYRGEDGLFTATSMLLAGGRAVRLLTGYWTVYLPSETRREMNYCWNMGTSQPNGVLRDLDARLQNASVTVSLRRSDGSKRPLSQGSVIGEALGSLQYEVAFKTGIAPMALDTPALETPWFDDITFAWQRASGPRILSWEQP